MNGAPQVLCEYMDLDPQLIEEEGAGGKKKLKFRGVFAKADQPTGNNRVYPREEWEREIKKAQQRIKERRMFGELDHPGDGRTSLWRVSHLITSLEIDEDGNIIGEAEVIEDSQAGRQLKAILKAGAKVGVSSRGKGTIEPADKGNAEKVTDFHLETFDIVANPSVQQAFPEFLREHLEKKSIRSIEELQKAYPELVEKLEQRIAEAFKQRYETTKAEIFQILKERVEELQPLDSNKNVIKELRKIASEVVIDEDIAQFIQNVKEKIKTLEQNLDKKKADQRQILNKMRQLGEAALGLLKLVQFERTVAEYLDRDTLRESIPFKRLLRLDSKEISDFVDRMAAKLEIPTVAETVELQKDIKKTLKRAYQALAAEQEARHQLEKELHAKETEIAEKEEIINRLSRQLEDNVETIKPVQDKIEQLANQTEGQKRRERKLRKTIKKLRQELEALQSKLQKMKDKKEEYKEEYKLREEELRNEINRLRGELQQYENDNEALRQIKEENRQLKQENKLAEAIVYAAKRYGARPNINDIIDRIYELRLTDKKDIDRLVQEEMPVISSLDRLQQNFAPNDIDDIIVAGGEERGETKIDNYELEADLKEIGISSVDELKEGGK